MIKRLKSLGASTEHLKDVYFKQVRSVLELAVPAWHSGPAQSDSSDIERVQRAALQIILGPTYSSYRSALQVLELETLATRRENLCVKFSKKAVKHHNQLYD